MILRRALLGSAASLALLPRAGRAAQDSVSIAVGGAVTTVDPQFHLAAPNNAFSAHIFDTITERDANNQTIPGIAKSWTIASDTAWDFTFREGVTWHDGVPFTADDVAFTLDRVKHVPNSTIGYGGFVQAIVRVEVTGPLTLRLHTAEPHPLLPNELGSIAVISRHVGETASTADYNSGKAAIGTGPYRLQDYRSSDRAIFGRNEAYWAGPEPWKTVTYRFVPNAAARVAALLSGDADLIDQVPGGDLARLRADRSVAVSEAEGGRVLYLSFNWARTGSPQYATDHAGQPLPHSPFRDPRVRRALSIAINRDGLARQLMEGTAKPTGQWLPPGSFGYNAHVEVPPYNPAAAKALLAEAGYPDGFRLTLMSPNDRYPNDTRIAQAIAQMWTRIGVPTQVDATPWSVFSTRSARQDFEIRLIGWGNGTGEASYALVNILSTFDQQRGVGTSNSGRYSNPALDALTTTLTATLDDDKRRALMEQAVAMAMDDVAIIPLMLLSNYWATRKDLAYEPRVDEHTVAMSLRPAT